MERRFETEGRGETCKNKSKKAENALIFGYNTQNTLHFSVQGVWRLR